MSNVEGAPKTVIGPLGVGATGHRPHRLLGADAPLLRRRVRGLLAALGRAAGSPEIVCSLAEGADRLVVTEAYRLGWPVTIVLPFDREEFARDFATAASRAEFDGLLGHAADVIELAGRRDGAGNGPAYAAANEAILHRADLLIAVWDGRPANGPGGTETAIHGAVARGLPVLCIAASPPHGVRLITPPTDSAPDAIAHLAETVGRANPA